MISPSNAESVLHQQPDPVPPEEYLNTHARRRRDIIARGGVQVLPDALLPK